MGEDRPNILWISSEDHGQEMGCYGDSYASTPQIDALAARGLRFRNVWSNAPVCAPARTAIITGCYPASLGAENMRSMVALPKEIVPFPVLMRKAGYYCSNNNKEDYNVVPGGKEVWDESSKSAHYRNRPQGKPFFAVFNATQSHESGIRNFKGKPKHDPALAPVPSFHPDTPLVRRDWAIYYDNVSTVDAIAGERLKELEAAGLADSTIVFYWGDHGSGMPRFKRWPSDSGLRVPLVVHIPERFKELYPPGTQAGGVSERLVSFVDFAPTMLSLIGIEPPKWMQGSAFLGQHIGEGPKYLFGFKGRMDERPDLVRSVTDGRYVYLRNYMPHRSQGQHLAYQMETPTTRQWNELYRAGKTDKVQSIFWTEPKESEEFYDLSSDPDEVNNLAKSPAHRELLERFRGVLRQQLIVTKDVGFMPEGERYRLAEKGIPFELARDAEVYPIEEVVNAAAIASRIDDTSTPTMDKVVALTRSPVAVLRYWGAMGIVMRGGAGFEKSGQALEALIDDESPAVRVVAAEGMARYGAGAIRERGEQGLLGLADWSKGDVFTSVAALNSMETLGERLAGLKGAIGRLPKEGEVLHNRYSSYVPRLLERLGELTGAGAPAGKAGDAP
jgi:uncharacterized sulfatase